ncbi:hypothetical protein ACFVYF_21930 [Streptomyces sp. NPDC058274]|uniref:hypothetical protein n=1 Tax=Streptomyces sp. NPDC058274 TaxID=3346416 RepID=UPI0036E99D57
MTSDDTSDHAPRGFTRSVRRFFWLPRDAPRDAAPIRPLARVWAALAVVGAGFAALGWGDMVVIVCVLGVLHALVDEVNNGVRHRWPAFVAALGAGWAVDRLVRAVTSAPTDPDWADYPGLAAGSLAAFAIFVAVTRLPGRPAGGPVRV